MGTPVHIMVDLETMSTAPNAAIISLGAYDFTPGPDPEDQRGLYGVVDHKWYDTHVLGQRFKVDIGTAYWWMQANPEAQSEVMFSESPLPLPAMLDAFTAYLKLRSGDRLDDVCLWGNGAAFDNVILASAYRAMGIEPPWKFYRDRCYRTLKALHHDVPVPPRNEGDAHHAFKDAAIQAAHLLAIASAKNIDLTTL